MKKKVFSIEEIKYKLEQYCIYQDRCHNDVEKKLSEYSLIPEAKEQITLHLLQENFLNEERFAKNYALGKFKNNKWGRIKIKYHLQGKGVSKSNIEIAVSQIDEDEYYKTLVRIAIKKANTVNEKNTFKKKTKITQYLYTRGFEMNLIMDTVKNIF